MKNHRLHEIRPVPEKAVLVGLTLDRTDEQAEDSLHELKRLAETAGAQVAAQVLQHRKEVNPRSFIGKGKVVEVAQLVGEHAAPLVIFDNDLTPGQSRNLEKDLGCRVLDRSELILDIFAKCARTHQAKVQVELAQLEYAYPRLRRMWTHLEKTEGVIGTRGPGETQLETDRRLIQKRIQRLKDRLQEIEDRKIREVQSRAHGFMVSLVGYTNAGKSTLLNRLSGAEVAARDQLFTTLDTRTRTWQLGQGRKVFLSDTVGFLQRLPHHLVASFHATLEEALHANLLLHVIDASHPNAWDQMAAVDEVLSQIGASTTPKILVFNKIDRMADRGTIELLRKNRGEAVVVLSAKTGEGIAELEKRVLEVIERHSVEVEVRTSASDGRAIHSLYQKTRVLEGKFEDEDFVARIQCTEEELGRLQGEFSSADVRWKLISPPSTDREGSISSRP